MVVDDVVVFRSRPEGCFLLRAWGPTAQPRRPLHDDVWFRLKTARAFRLFPKLFSQNLFPKERTVTMSQESSDHYHSVLFRVGNRHRVIRCKNDIQYILQRSSGSKWVGMSYCTTADSVITCMNRKGLNTVPAMSYWSLPQQVWNKLFTSPKNHTLTSKISVCR